MLKTIFFLLLFTGVFSFSLFVLNNFFFKKKIDHNNQEYIHHNCLLISSSWFLSLGFFGIVQSIIFYLNNPNNISYYIIYLISIIGFILLIKSKNLLYKSLKNFFLLIKDFLNNNIFFIIIFIFLLLIYILKIPLLWHDIDEITQYGLYTKLAANNWNLNSDAYGLFIRYGEISHSFFYSVFDNNYLPKILRLFSLLFNVLLIYSICRLLKISKNLSLLSSLIFLSTPEIAYIGLSMKTDILLLNYELMSLILLIYVTSKLYIYKTNKFEISFDKFNFKILILALVFSSIALSIRYSAIYLYILNILLIFLYIFINYRKNIKFNFIFRFLIFYILIAFLIFFCFFYNIYIFQNPFYPLEGFWLELFANGKSAIWGGGTYEEIKSQINIKTNNPLFSFLYIIIYHAMGLEEDIYSSLKFIIHPENHAGAGWLTPLTLIIYLSIFLFKKSKLIFIYSLYFLFLYFFWINGIQYSRIFIASSTITIIITAIFLNITFTNKYIKIINKMIYFGIVLILVICTYYHFVSLKYQNPSLLKLFYDEDIKFITQYNRAIPSSIWRSSKKEIDAYIGDKFNKNDIKIINNLLKNNNKKYYIINLTKYENIHVFFNKGYFKNYDNINIKQFDKERLFSKNHNTEFCFIGNQNDFDMLKLVNFENKYLTKNKILFTCEKE